MKRWRMLPPGGAPLVPAALVHGLWSGIRGNSSVEALRMALCERFSAEHVFFAGSGRAALALLFSALRERYPERDEVLIPAYVSFSVPAAVACSGCRIALYDLDPASLTPDYESLRESLSERTLAVVACHQFGLAFDLAPLAALCRDVGTVLVDDAAQAMGGRVGNAFAGTLGDIGLFSLSRGKPMTAVEGGILLTNDNALAAALADADCPPVKRYDAVLAIKALALLLLRRPEFYRLPASLPWLNLGASIFDPDFPQDAFTCFQAGLAAHALGTLEGVNAQRAAKAALYRERIKDLPGVKGVEEQPATLPVHARFPLLPQEQGKSLTRLTESGQARELGISPGFPSALDDIPALGPHRAHPGREYPGARFLAANLITLPTHDLVREKDCLAALEYLAEVLEPRGVCHEGRAV